MPSLLRSWILLGASMLLALQGCSSTPGGQSVDADALVLQRQQGSDVSSPWISFGVVLTQQSIIMESEGQSAPGMRLSIVFDDGRRLVVEQLLSQAGELAAGQRVRVLQIGDYSRVTYWPYPASR